MKMDFHAEKNKTSYTGRGASDEWRECILGLVDIRNKDAADIGCGGGIYSRALVELGAAHVSEVDFSAAMLDAARDYCAGIVNTSLSTKDHVSTKTGQLQGLVPMVGITQSGQEPKQCHLIWKMTPGHAKLWRFTWARLRLQSDPSKSTNRKQTP